MATDKIERFREVLTMRITPAQFDALVAAVRADERQKCITAVAGVDAVTLSTHDTRKMPASLVAEFGGWSIVHRAQVVEAIRNA